MNGNFHSINCIKQYKTNTMMNAKNIIRNVTNMNCINKNTRMNASSLQFHFHNRKGIFNSFSTSSISSAYTSTPSTTQFIDSANTISGQYKSSFASELASRDTLLYSATTNNANDVSSSSSIAVSTENIVANSDNVNLSTTTDGSLSDAIVSTLSNAALNDPTMSSLGYTPDAFITRLLCFVHDYTGLPWYGAIILTTIGVRVALLPVVIKSIRNVHRLRLAKPEMERLQQMMKENPPLTEADKQRYMLITRVSSYSFLELLSIIYKKYYWKMQTCNNCFSFSKKNIGYLCKIPSQSIIVFNSNFRTDANFPFIFLVIKVNVRNVSIF